MGSNVAWALLGWMLCNAVLLACSYRLTLSLSTGLLRLDLLTLGVSHVALTTWAVWLAGLTGTLVPHTFVIASLLIAAAAAMARRHVFSPSAAAAARHHRAQLRALLRWPSRPLQRVALGALGLLVVFDILRLAANVWLLPPFVWDVWTYHLPRVAEWVRAETLVSFDTPVVRVYWPANFELLQTWFVLFPHHDAVVELAGVVFYVLCCQCVYATGRALALDRGWALLATVTYAHCPMLLLSATSSKNDIAIAFTFLLTMALAADLRARPATSPGPHLLVAILALCFAVGTKPYVLLLGGGIAVMAAWVVVGRGGGVRFAHEVGAGVRSIAGSRGTLLALATLALPLAAYWYARNWVLFHNPMHPTDVHLFGQLVFGTGEGSGQQGRLSLQSLLDGGRNLLTEQVFDRHQPFDAEANRTANWGWFAFSCGLPTMALALWWSAPLRWLGLAFAAALAGLLAGVTPDPWTGRFMAWVPAVLSLAFCVVVSRLGSKLWRGALIALALVTTVLNTVGTLEPGRLTPAQWAHMAELPVWQRTPPELGRHIGHWYRESLAAVPAHETLGYDVDENGWTYPLYGPGFGRAIHYVPLTAETNVAGVLRAAGLRYLFVPAPTPDAEACLQRAVAEGTLHRVARGLYAR